MKRIPVIFLLAALLSLPALPAAACTLYAAAGRDDVQGGGTILVKNRDWRPQHQEVRLVDEGGWRFYGLFAGNGTRKALKGGVNEQGLAIVSASASSIPREERLGAVHRASMKTILKRYTTVEEVLQHKELFAGAKFLMLADRSRIAYVEITPDNRIRVRETARGTLAHTNHYLEPSFQSYNKRHGTSSMVRLVRIRTLMDQTKRPYQMADFIRFSEDRHAGPDNSIWRSGSTREGTQTLAVLAIRIPPAGLPEVYIKCRANPDDQDREQVIQTFPFTSGEK